MKQLSIFDRVEEIQNTQIRVIQKDEPYRNGLGELLPWEEPEYLKTK